MDRWLPPDSAPGLAREKPRHSLLYPDAYAFVNAVCSGERPCPMPGQSTQVKKCQVFNKVFASWICGVSSGVSVALRFLVDDGRYGER